MKYLKLNKNFIAKLDDDDFIKYAHLRWFISDQGYVKHSTYRDGKFSQVRLHRLILNAPKDIFVDHINGDKLDNRKSNLRLCSNAENMRNRNAPVNNTSGYKGVSWMKTKMKWRARIKVFYKEIWLGLFNSKEDAAKAYNIAAQKKFGRFANLNVL